MNDALRRIAIKEIEFGLSLLNAGCNKMFKRMYPGSLSTLTDDQLNTAMDQVIRSLGKPHLLRAAENPREVQSDG